MRVDKVQVNSGLLAKNCVTEFKGKHFVVADGDIVLFDGQNVESIADKRVRKTIFDDMDSVNYALTHVACYDSKNEIWVCYPTTTQGTVDKAAVWNWRDNTWTFRDLVDTYYVTSGVSVGQTYTIDGLTGTIDTLSVNYSPTIDRPAESPISDTLHNATTLAIHAIDQTNDIDGSAFASRLEKATMDLGDPESIKIVDAVVPRITAGNGTIVYIRVGTQFNPDDAIVWSSEQTYTVGTDREAHFHEKGRFISVRFRTDGIGVNWKLHGFYIKAKPSGRY